MTVLDFCKHREVQATTVMQYIRRNPEKFEGHTSKNGISWEIDEFALKLLEDKYPMPAEIMAPLDAELARQLEEQKDLIIELQQKIIKQNDLISSAQANQLLLTERTTQIEELKIEKADLTTENAALVTQIAELQAQLHQSQEETKRAQETAESLRNRTFWQRLFNT